MADTEDLYAALGIHRTASDQDIAKAYKSAAFKVHPDRHSHKWAHLPEKEAKAEQAKYRAAWDKVARAYAILSNAALRARYDRTGVIEDLGVDLTEASAISLLNAILGQAIRGEVDPNETLDFLVQIRAKLQGDLADIAKHKRMLERAKKRAERMQKKLKRKDKKESVLVRGLNWQLEAIAGELGPLKAATDIHELALKMLDEHEFQADQPEPFGSANAFLLSQGGVGVITGFGGSALGGGKRKR